MTAFAWRCFYAIFERPLVVSLARSLIGALSTIVGERRAQGLVAAIERRWVRGGWPYQSPGWVNLHLARFLTTMRHPTLVQRVRTARPPADRGQRRLKVGVIGPFNGLLGFPAALFAAFPSEHDLVLFDEEYGGAFATYLASLPVTYTQVSLENPAAIATTVEVIRRSNLDLLIVTMSKAPAHELVDLLDVPCIAHWASGSEPLYHANIDFELFPQPQADYFIVRRRLFCATTRTQFDGQRFVPIDPYYDLRDLNVSAMHGFREREALITFHGSLYKLAQPAYLDLLLRLLADEREAQFVFMGKDNGIALDAIRRAAAHHGVAHRVHYEGSYNSVRNEAGNVGDAGWARMTSLLSRARLAANPWPIGGASARIEAYAAGVPCPGMRLSFHERDWNRRQLVVCDVPALHVRAASAWSPDEYVNICRKTLHDESFFEQVVAEQRHALRHLTDAGRWWRDVLDAYFEWLRELPAGRREAS